METEIIPAILVKSREDLIERINRVKDSVATVHIDVMDDEFVPNKTVGPESFHGLPENIRYEFHWMVKNPQDYILRTKGEHIHLVHVEAIEDWDAIKKATHDSGGILGIAINPPTELERLDPYLSDVSRVLVMSVNPGFDGQKYMASVEEKVRSLRKRFPNLNIEVDGGISPETAGAASTAGADKLAASSAIYKHEDTQSAITALKNAARSTEGSL
ncbi:MAG: hypothetical protein ABIG39_06880 [Candidatus Micrarchaeota archaeon]